MADLLNLTKDESLHLLDLRKEKVQLLCLEKPELVNRVSRVGVVIDWSGSMSHLVKNGTVQAVIERLLPIAMQFDDNGEMEIWLFSNGFYRLKKNITLKNFYGYIKAETGGYSMGGTQYAPVINDVIKKYTEEEPAELPNYIMFITDGDNSDKSEAEEAIRRASHAPIFWQFVGIGSASFPFLEKLDNMEGRYVDNANFFSLNDIMSVSDDDLYKRLLAEYPSWLADAKVKELIENPKPIPAEAGKKGGFFSKFFH